MEREQLFRWEEIEPLCVLRLLFHKLWLILLAALIGMMSASIVLNSLITEQFTTSATFAVSSRSGGVAGYANINSAAETAAIYSELLQGRLTTDLITQYNGQLPNKITTEQLGGTNLLKVSVSADAPEDSLAILQTIIDHQDTLSQYISDTAVLTVVSTPSITSSFSHSFDRTKLCFLTGLGCAGVMVLLLCFLCMTSGTIQNRIGAKNTLDAKILVSIPHEGLRSSWKQLLHRSPRRELNILSPSVSFGFTEAVHRIAARFEHEHTKGRKVFLFSSVSEAEGKSTVAANTALSLVSKGPRVLFIDLDLRRPVQHRILNMSVPRENEFGRMLSSSQDPETILAAAVRRQDTSLYTLLSARSYPDMVERLSSQLLADVIRLARSHFDYVIIDSPPLGYFSDSEILSDLADASVLIVRQDLVPAPKINDAIDALRAGKSHFLGCILNDMRHLSASSSSYGYGYGGRYYGKYGRYGKYGKYGYGKKDSANNDA